MFARGVVPYQTRGLQTVARLRKQRLIVSPRTKAIGTSSAARHDSQLAQWQRRWGYSNGDGVLSGGSRSGGGGGAGRRAFNQLPFFVERKVYGLNLAEICGHASFLVLGLGYLEHDVLKLRVLAATGMSLGVIFQYFRPQPLYIPIGWNFVFFGINCCMVAALLKERADAKENVTDEQRNVHDRLFNNLELTQYMHLIAEAKREVLPSGTHITCQGEFNEKLYLILSGSGDVFIDGEFIGETGEDSFIAEMSFAAYLRDEAAAATADVIVGEGGPMVVLVWDFKELKEFLHKNPETGAPICGTLAHDIALKMNRSRTVDLGQRRLSGPHSSSLPSLPLPSSSLSSSSLPSATSSSSSSSSAPLPLPSSSASHASSSRSNNGNRGMNNSSNNTTTNNSSSSSSTNNNSSSNNNNNNNSRSGGGSGGSCGGGSASGTGGRVNVNSSTGSSSGRSGGSSSGSSSNNKAGGRLLNATSTSQGSSNPTTNYTISSTALLLALPA